MSNKEIINIHVHFHFNWDDDSSGNFEDFLMSLENNQSSVFKFTSYSDDNYAGVISLEKDRLSDLYKISKNFNVDLDRHINGIQKQQPMR